MKDGTARVEENRVAVFDHVGRPAGDPPFGNGVDLGPDAERGADKIAAISHNGPTAHPGQLACFF